MTQEVLSHLSSDQVNSIFDTPESVQVANIIQRKYYDITARGDLPEHESIFQLNASGNQLQPTLMTVPTGVTAIKWVKYFDTNIGDSQQVDQFGSFAHDLNLDIVSPQTWTTTSTTSNTIATGSKTFTVASSTLPIVLGQGVLCTAGTNNMFGTVTSYAGTTLTLNITSTVGSGTFNSWIITASNSNSFAGYKYVTVLPFNEFMDMINRFDPAETDIGSYTFTENGSNFTLYYKNDIQPLYCTILSNFTVLFDSFDITQDNTLQSSKTLVLGQIIPTFQMLDSFIPDLDDMQFPLLINEATSLAFYELRQMPHPQAEREIKRHWSALQKDKAVSNKPSPFDQLPDFGRLSPRPWMYSKAGTRWTRF
jgi:hypothetical protein